MIVIERYRDEMAAALREVFYTAIRNVCIRDYSLEQVKAWAPDDLALEVFQKLYARITPVVAKIEDKVVGYTDLQEDGLIDHFFVHSDFQSQGVATELMAWVLHEGRDMEKIYSNVSITAQPFFKRRGFVVVKQQEVEMRGCVLNNAVLERRQ